MKKIIISLIIVIVLIVGITSIFIVRKFKSGRGSEVYTSKVERHNIESLVTLTIPTPIGS